MKLGAVDIGTNSTRLMISQLIEGGNLESLRREAVVTRLGEGVNETSYLKQSAISRTLEVLKNYRKTLDQEQVDKVIVAATSAVREGKNSEDFLDQVELLMGTKPHVLSGEEEAQLSFLGATYDLSDSSLISYPSSAQLILVLDIGGGSTELIVGQPPKISKEFSLDIGCVRVTEMFLKSDPPSTTEVEATRRHIQEILVPVVSKIRGSHCWTKDHSAVLIGVAGTITTISAIKQRMGAYDPKRIHHSKLQFSEINKILETLLSMSLSERKKIVGLEPKRADVIVAGALIASVVMEKFDLREIIVSEHDILDGLILSLLHFKAVF